MTLTRRPDAAAQARAEIVRLGRLISPELRRDLLVVVSELVANSVKFGPDERIRVSLRLRPDGTLFGEVSDGGCDGVALDRERPPELGGMGLRIVDALSRTWGVRPRSSSVWFELGLSGAHL